jgi:hypothetical protein
MNKLALIPVAIALTLFASCGKQQTEAEKNAEIERQVQQRLDAQHQAEAQKQLAAREADLAAREKTLADQQNAAAETPALQTPAPRREPAAGGEFGFQRRCFSQRKRELRHVLFEA